jgi:hypothetical protein
MTWNWNDPINRKAKKIPVKKIIQKKNVLKKDGCWLGLILQIYYLDYEIEVASLKKNLKKQRSKILNQTNIEGWNWEKNQ